MAKYFDISPVSGTGNGSISVIPKAGFTGRGPVNESVVVTAVNDPTKKGTAVCTRSGVSTELNHANWTISTSPTLDGVYTPLTKTSDDPYQVEVSIPAAACFMKVVIPAYNAEDIGLENLLNQATYETYAKMFGGWITDDGHTLSQTRVKFNITDGAPFTPTGDPGIKEASTVEIFFKIDANTAGFPVQKRYDIHTPSDGITAFLVIYQARGVSTLTVSPNTLDFGTSTAAKQLAVTSNDNWTAAIN